MSVLLELQLLCTLDSGIKAVGKSTVEIAQLHLWREGRIKKLNYSTKHLFLVTTLSSELWFECIFLDLKA